MNICRNVLSCMGMLTGMRTDGIMELDLGKDFKCCEICVESMHTIDRCVVIHARGVALELRLLA